MPAAEVEVATGAEVLAEGVDTPPALVVGAAVAVAVAVGTGAEPAPGGGVVGTVLGWFAVFQVAAVGQAVVATVGETVPNGVGPGTEMHGSDPHGEDEYGLLTLVGLGRRVDVNQDTLLRA